MLKLITFRCLLFSAAVAVLWMLELSDLVLFNIGGRAGMAVLAFAIYVVTGGYYTVYLVWHTLPRDMR
jgi:hypothetical protein